MFMTFFYLLATILCLNPWSDLDPISKSRSGWKCATLIENVVLVIASGCFVYFSCIVDLVLYHRHLSGSADYADQIGSLELYEPGKSTKVFFKEKNQILNFIPLLFLKSYLIR